MFEKSLSIIIGLILINNFYYLGFFFGINYQVILVCTSLITFLFFLKGLFFFKDSLNILFFNSIITPIVLLITFFSCLFFYIVPHDVIDIDSNDLIRLIILFFYFSWLRFKYYNNDLLKWFLIRLSFFSLIINIFLIFFETSFPGIFGLMFKLEKIFDDETWTKRVAGTIGDSNAFGCSLIIYYFFLFTFYLKEKSSFIVNLLCLFGLFYLVNLTGSRQGLLIYALVVLYVYNVVEVSKVFKFYSLLLVIVCSLVYIVYSVTKSESEIDSAITRIFKENEKAEASSIDRWQSILNGFYFSFKNYFALYGPGSILHNKLWHKQFKEYIEVTPHNLLVFLFSQFGFWALSIYYYIYKVFVKSFQKKLHFYSFIFLGLIFFLPNIIYYGITLLLIFFIDSYKRTEQTKYENSFFASIN